MTKKATFRPELFGKFFLLQRLGAGGMAEIFRAKTAGAGGFEKELVVKRILPTLSSDDQFVRMLVNEAKLTVALTHPTIAQIYELGEVNGEYFISMELVEGATLHEVMHLARQGGRPLGLEQSIFLCLEVLRGLGYAHKKTDGAGNPLGIIHCDVSPDNVMVTWDGGVKLLDFGVARAAQASLSNHREGTLMGKLSYASPEQAEGANFDHRVDLFAVGVMFYELLTGEHPFGRVSNIEELAKSRKKAVVAPSKIASLPKDFDSFIKKSLAYSADDRFQTAQEMAGELLQMLFPTDTLEVAAHLASTMKEIYRESIERQQKLRANDSVHMKVLAHVSKDPAGIPAQKDGGLDAALGTIPAAAGTKIFVSALDDSKAGTPPFPSRPPAPRSQPRRTHPVTRPHEAGGKRGGRTASFLIGLLLGAGLAGGGAFAYFDQRPPTLVVLSQPPGAEVFLRGFSLGKTPLIQEETSIPPGNASVVLRLENHREVEVPIEIRGRVARAEAALASSLGRLRIESTPSGATVRMNGDRIGNTPLEIGDLPVDVRHRFDLERAGYQVDSFVVRPDDLAQGVVRRMLRRD